MLAPCFRRRTANRSPRCRGTSYSDDLRGLSKLTTVRGFEEIIMPNSQVRDWRTDGVKVIKSDRLDSNTPQTPGMLRAAAVNAARGSQKIWAGTVIIHPNAKTGAHHHGALESVIYVVRGIARMRWGERLEFVAEADAGDFIFVPPYVPHQEINRSSDAPL